MQEEYIRKILSLDGAKAVVTGGSSGIGRGIALSLAAFGAQVTVLGRNRNELQETVRMTEENGANADFAVVDISHEHEVNEFFRNYEERNTGPDILVANAGVNVRAELLETDPEDLDRLLNVNYKGTIFCLKEAGRYMRKQRKGNILIITSINGVSAMANLAIYSSIKYALEGLTRAMAVSMAPYGVRVNSIAPGVILSGMNQELYGQEDILKAKLKDIPLGHIGYPADVGDVAACIVSDAYRFVTGTTTIIDGGELLRKPQKQ